MSVGLLVPIIKQTGSGLANGFRGFETVGENARLCTLTPSLLIETVRGVGYRFTV